MKMMKTRLQNKLRDVNFSCLKKIATESSLCWFNDERKEIVDIWNKKNICLLHVFLFCLTLFILHCSAWY